jgi:ABC-type transporter Mla MlaB component
MRPRQPLRIEATVTSTRDLGHLALHATMLSGTTVRRPIHLDIDLSACTSLNPAGVNLLADLHRRLAVCGGGVTLVRPPAAVRHLLGTVPAGLLPTMTDEVFQ